jgi:ParB-like chromosome segregation protein Spo0J
VNHNTEGAGADLAYIAEPLRPLAVPIESLSLDPANVRKHDERNLGAIAASLSRWGQRFPIVVQRQGMVVRAGNGRLVAAKSLGWKHIAAVVVDESSVEATAFAIADNRTAELAEWDNEGLAALLQSMDKDMQEVAGFNAGDLDALLAEMDVFNASEVEPPELAHGDREPFRQMTFTVHDSQFPVIEQALKAAKSSGGGNSGVNENSNGNALAFVCEAFNNG